MYSSVRHASVRPVGDHLREWRQRRRLSQLDLACDAEVSTRHLSFVETGRSQPSREMVLRLAERLEVPLRERNALLVAAGYAPSFPERSMDDPDLAEARRAVELVLAGHEPFPALAVDRWWNLVSANRAVAPLLEGIDPALLAAPANVLRISLHPQGLAPRVVNFSEWRTHLLDRLRRQVEISADPRLSDLLDELRAYHQPAAQPGVPRHGGSHGGVAVPVQLKTSGGVLNFITTTTVFGTAIDVTLSELTLECFFPADAATARALATG